MSDMSWVFAFVVTGLIAWAIFPSKETADREFKLQQRYKARMRRHELAEKALLVLIEQGVPEEKAAKMAYAYVDAFAEEQINDRQI